MHHDNQHTQVSSIELAILSESLQKPLANFIHMFGNYCQLRAHISYRLIVCTSIIQSS